MSPIPFGMRGLFREAKRRRLFVSVMAYLAISITIIELSGAIFKALLLPDWAPRLVTILLILGFPVVVVLAWIFDVTREGVRRTEAEQPDQAEQSGQAVHTGSVPSPPRRGRVPGVRRVGRGSTDASRGRKRSRPSAGTSAEPEIAVSAARPDPERVKHAALGHVRHELKTPINAILGYSEMLLEDLSEEDRKGIGADLENIHTAGGELLDLVDQILNPARLSRHAGELDLEAYGSQIRADLRDPINAVVGYSELLIEASEESERIDMIPDLERIRTAAIQLLELSTDIVQVATSPEGQAATQRLATAAALTQDVLAKAGPTPGASGSGDGRGTLLVVDDNAMNRELLSRQLARAGYVVQTADSGAEAIRYLEDRSFDLVLLDVIMPEMDGLEVLRRVKREERTAGTPVIMLSSLDDMASAIRCIELGAEDFLSKPFHPTLLQARIGTALEIRRLGDRAESDRTELEEAEALIARLLKSTFPGPIAERVRAGETEIVESYEEATVLWCDVEGSTRLREPGKVAERLREILATIEAVSDRHELESVASLRGGVVVVGGVPVPCEDHAGRIADAALDIQAALSDAGNGDGPIRLGMDCGEVTSGVLGGERLSYRVWGEPVNLARALGGQASRGAIMASPAIHEILADRYVFGAGRVQEIPERGQMRTYVLEGPA